MMILRLLIVAAWFLPLTVADACPAMAQTQTYNAEATGDQGGLYGLVIHRSGDRLTFEMTAKRAVSSRGSMPACERTTLRPDGTFLTYCNGFFQQGRRYHLEGSLNQRTAKIENVIA